MIPVIKSLIFYRGLPYLYFIIFGILWRNLTQLDAETGHFLFLQETQEDAILLCDN